MPVRSLRDLAKQRLIQNVDSLNDVGDLPYSFLRPILIRIEKPAQLAELEKNCPQLLGETGEIWLRFVKRDIPNYFKKPYQPKDPKKWAKVYNNLKKDAEEEMQRQEDELRAKLKGLQDAKQLQTTQIYTDNRGVGNKRPKETSWRSSTTFPSKAKVNPHLAAIRSNARKDYGSQQKTGRVMATSSTPMLGRVQAAPARMVRDYQEQGQVRQSVEAIPRAAPRPVNTTGRQAGASTASTTSSQSMPARAPVGQVSLPKDQVFRAPRVSPPSGQRPQKRKRPEANPFMPKKARKA
ncbi:hypothetical protein GQ43DRAFT_10896 [Delitschia confertaspora ATCC 74209]|uniref:Elongin-A n=1 Tax=Delitschia confertaspora ATCC 74209 TaxID=1513339 RepID=A0A9P4MZM6_9PLEO|nr:hypothetical protein GQ43DRAFT_10896 [Delitschia confertaspora ATCC 74209]